MKVNCLSMLKVDMELYLGILISRIGIQFSKIFWLGISANLNSTTKHTGLLEMMASTYFHGKHGSYPILETGERIYASNRSEGLGHVKRMEER